MFPAASVAVTVIMFVPPCRGTLAVHETVPLAGPPPPRLLDQVTCVNMGKHHALPATEVKEVISLKGYRNLPGLPSIVIGVSEHNGALLPVIDIEACFGIKSEMTKSWKMIHLENGDFSALVITKAALDEKELPPELHRKIPLIMKKLQL